MFLRTQFIDQIDFFHVIMPQLFIGVAGAFFWGPLIAIAMTEVPQEKISSAAGMLTFTRTLVFAMTIALLTTFWETGTKEAHAELSSVLNEPMSTLSTLETAGITAQQSTFILNSMVDNQSVIIALHQISWSSDCSSQWAPSRSGWRLAPDPAEQFRLLWSHDLRCKDERFYCTGC